MIVNKIPIVAIVGRPNVGKSTLFNRLIGVRQAITSKVPGTTRDRVSGTVEWGKKLFTLVDTAGLIVDFYGYSEEDIEKAAQEQIRESLRQADMVLFVVDGKAGLHPDDEEAGRLLRQFARKVILAVNKVEGDKVHERIGEFAGLGFEKMVAVSALTGQRTGRLLDVLTEDMPDSESGSGEATELAKLSIVGRPNVGKSTLFNALTKSKSAIVARVAGTTRDAQSLRVKLSDGSREADFEIVDTAGLRRSGKVGRGVEKFSVIRAVRAVLSSDIVLLVAEASEGMTRGDAHIAQLALERKKKLIVAINKIDLLKRKSSDEIKDLNRFAFLGRNPMVAISAETGENLALLIKELIRLRREQ